MGPRTTTRWWRAFPLALLILASAWMAVAAHAAGGDDAYRRGIAAATAGQYPVAAHELEQAILLGHNDPDAYYQLGLAYSKLKRWNDAVWAIVTSLGDSRFSSTQPSAGTALDAAQRAGGANVGPPPILRDATMSALKATPLDPAKFAVQESHAAFSALQTQTFFVSPEFHRTITAKTSVALSTAAEDLQNSSSTVAKFVYLGATPLPFTDLRTYTRSFFTRLGLQRAILVVVTPNYAAAYSDRLDAASIGKIIDQRMAALGAGDPIALATSIARSAVAQADSNDSGAAHRSLALGGLITLLVLSAVALAIRQVLRSDANQSRRAAVPPSVARSRAR